MSELLGLTSRKGLALFQIKIHTIQINIFYATLCYTVFGRSAYAGERPPLRSWDAEIGERGVKTGGEGRGEQGVP
jgi:hypothetical protein